MRDDTDGRASGDHVAVIGMAGRFPGADDVAEYWRNLCGSVECLTRFTEAELLAAGEQAELLRNPAYVRTRPVLRGADLYDADFFGHSPLVAAVMDPQHRIFLETAWEALEIAGYAGPGRPPSVGVFAACGPSTYMRDHLLPNRELMDSMGEWLVRHTANDPNFLATRVSYELDLRGPSLNVQTACSSALVAIHLAIQSLLAGECDLALAGASSIALPQDRGYLYREGGVLSPDGRCRPFDARARGVALGSGAGCVVLKRLGDALADRDDVLAIVRGSAFNNDGAAKLGYLAPSIDGQARVVAEALAIAGVEPQTIGYVETHGTGTLVGDAIEVAALAQAYGAGLENRGYCALGSVKPNIGHLGEAAGIASFIKAVLALRHGLIPPTLNYETPNPEIDFARTPFFVNTEAREWASGASRRRAGVTALGVGGTNAHVVLEEADEPARHASSGPALLVLSAKDDAALERAARDLARHLREHPTIDLSDVAFTLQVGRRAFPCRRALVCADRDDALRLLEGAWRSDRGPRVAHGSHDGARVDPATMAAAERWAAGVDVDWQALHETSPGRRVPLPTYPFQRRRHWFERMAGGGAPVQPLNQPSSVVTSTRARPLVRRPPRNDVERELVVAFRDVLSAAEVGVDDDFFALGGNSLAAARLFDRIRRTYGVDLSPSTLFAAPSVATCAEVVARELESRAPGSRGRPAEWPTLVAMQPRGSRPPLFFLAGIGGTLTNLRRLAVLLGDDQPCYGFQPPGLDGRQKRLGSIEAIAARYVEDLNSIHPTGPVLLAGYSGGGVAAYEMARQLARAGREVALLAFIDSTSPALPRRSARDRLALHGARLRELGAPYVGELVLRRLRYERAEAARRVKRALSGAFPERYRYDAVMDAWLEAERAYSPGAFDGSATLFQAAEASGVSLWSAFEVDSEYGWGRFVLRGVTVVRCPGDHGTICEEPHVQTLAAKLRSALDRALSAADERSQAVA